MTILSDSDRKPEKSADVDRRLMPPPPIPEPATSTHVETELTGNDCREGMHQSNVDADSRHSQGLHQELETECELLISQPKKSTTQLAPTNTIATERLDPHQGSRRFCASATGSEHRMNCLNTDTGISPAANPSLPRDVIDLTDNDSDNGRDPSPNVDCRPWSPQSGNQSSKAKLARSVAWKQKVARHVPRVHTARDFNLRPRLNILKKCLPSKQDVSRKKSFLRKPLSKMPGEVKKHLRKVPENLRHQSHFKTQVLSKIAKSKLSPIQTFLFDQWNTYHAKDDRRGQRSNPIEL